MELLLINHDVVLWTGQSPAKGVFGILIYVPFHQQSICYCSIVVIHLLFSSPTARTSAKRFWISACWDRAHCFSIFMKCVVHWHSFSKGCFPRLMRQWHNPLWLYVPELHVCRGSQRRMEIQLHPEVLKFHCCTGTELSAHIWVMLESKKPLRKNRYL